MSDISNNQDPTPPADSAPPQAQEALDLDNDQLKTQSPITSPEPLSGANRKRRKFWILATVGFLLLVAASAFGFIAITKNNGQLPAGSGTASVSWRVLSPPSFSNSFSGTSAFSGTVGGLKLSGKTEAARHRSLKSVFGLTKSNSNLGSIIPIVSYVGKLGSTPFDVTISVSLKNIGNALNLSLIHSPLLTLRETFLITGTYGTHKVTGTAVTTDPILSRTLSPLHVQARIGNSTLSGVVNITNTTSRSSSPKSASATYTFS